MGKVLSRKVLARAFFERPTVEVARDLLGKYIVARGVGGEPGRAVMITETEAYDGPLDRASHASRGMTPRNKVMFGPAAVFYVYFVYGMHWMVNVVTGPREYPAAVLLRAGVAHDPRTGAVIRLKGPALLARHLGMTGKATGFGATRRNGFWFEDRGVRVAPREIFASRRIGVDYAGPIWSKKRYNFRLKIPLLSPPSYDISPSRHRRGI